MKDLRGKTAVVTGAASGIGRGFAERFVAEGMNVVLADYDEPALERATAELSAQGGKVLGVPTDVSDGAAVAALAAKTTEAFGGVHLVCNNAGVGGGGGPLWMLSENDWKWALGVNLWGVIHGIRAFTPLMLAQGGEGHIVNTASMAGLAAPTFMGAYVATKHAVVALSEVLARDLEAFGARIGVSVLCPGFVKTNIHATELHRPKSLANPDVDPALAGQRDMLMAAMKDLIEQGKPPSEIADHVVNAVRDNRFYILPHPEMKGLVKNRMDDILEGRTPRFDPEQFLPQRNKA
jgi:NAD(P)-dependent dehydrogenase (short-subunit alcohol dehydrogenase family)